MAQKLSFVMITRIQRMVPQISRLKTFRLPCLKQTLTVCCKTQIESFHFRELLQPRNEIVWPVVPKDNVHSAIDHEIFGLSRNPRKPSCLFQQKENDRIVKKISVQSVQGE
jgi:hypothetical protein